MLSRHATDFSRMRYFSFAFYYLVKYASVKLGFYRTFNPVTIAWRWQHWNRKRKKGRIR